MISIPMGKMFSMPVSRQLFSCMKYFAIAYEKRKILLRWTTRFRRPFGKENSSLTAENARYPFVDFCFRSSVIMPVLKDWKLSASLMPSMPGVQLEPYEFRRSFFTEKRPDRPHRALGSPGSIRKIRCRCD